MNFVPVWWCWCWYTGGLGDDELRACQVVLMMVLIMMLLMMYRWTG